MQKGSALNGLNVLDLGRVVAGPHCTAILADLGAHVIKIESPKTGDIARENMPKTHGISTYFVTFNRSKKGITIDLKTEKGKEILRKLILKSDVLVENFRPGVMKRLGFSYADCAKINPRLIYASISGFGQTGPYSERACFDPIAQAMSGISSVTGQPDGYPVRCGASIADILAGQNAAIAILAALTYRENTGKGQWIDVALTDSCIVALSSIYQIYFTTGKVPRPNGNSFEASAPGNSFPAKDGKIIISAGQDKEWEIFARAMDCNRWLADPRFINVHERVKNREILDEIISKETAKYTVDELLGRLLDAGLPAGPIMSVDKAANDPQFRDEREMFVDVEHPVLGNVTITNQGIKMSETSPYVRSCSPILGQHNYEVLTDLGYSEEQIENLSKNGVI